MNEIITRLNEIEEKAGELLCSAKMDKEHLAAQLEQQKRTIDEKFERMETESAQRLREQLMSEARRQMDEMRQRSEKAGEELETRFRERKEQLAEEMFRRVIG